ncbi:MAG TPA: hypothetical protein VHX60_07040 [Acidobacteriaceae bacterium]|jgi:hypothetical protein|nr:hypothetical protein [Acidobacteriaceae bacterium]
MERDFPPKPYQHPNEWFKTACLFLAVVAIPEALHGVWSLNLWFAESIGLVGSLLLLALMPPRVGPRKVAVFLALMSVIVAVQCLAHLYFRRPR